MIPKFRVWLPDIDQMLRVKALVFEEDKTRCVCGYSFDFYLEDENATIMQSTGLKDKNGQEIFEGDIVKRDGIKRPEVVRFGEWIDVDSLGYKEQYIGFYFESEHEGQEWLHSVEPQFNHLSKVIGNIYENKDILEVINEKRK